MQNNAVFSAFKAHRAQNDMAALLLDSNGNRKPFKQWMKDVLPIADHHNRIWLRTEYSMAVGRAHLAADWQQFLDEKDVLPNLEWMPSSSVTPDQEHASFVGTILPVDDPFWAQHHPLDHWGCKCSLESTDKPTTDKPNSTETPQPGLDNNPGIDAKLFSDSHPYITYAYDGAKKAVHQAITEQMITRRKELQQIASKEIQGNSYKVPQIKNKIFISKDSVREFLNQPHKHYALKNELIKNIGQVLHTSKYVTKHVPFKKNKKTENVKYEHFFEISILGDKSWLIVWEYKDGNTILHGISESGKVLLNPLKKNKEH